MREGRTQADVDRLMELLPPFTGEFEGKLRAKLGGELARQRQRERRVWVAEWDGLEVLLARAVRVAWVEFWVIVGLAFWLFAR